MIPYMNSIHELTDNAGKTLTQSVVISRLDYCNSVCLGLPMKSIHRLQLAQNAAARVIKRTTKRAHMTPVLRDLHCLPINRRIEFKILLFVFKVLHSEAPPYVCDLLNWYHPNRHLKSSIATPQLTNLNKTVKFRKKIYGCSSCFTLELSPR